MKTLSILAVLLALAQPAAAETLLRLSETAHLSVHPDELVAALRGEASAATPTEAQASVNGAIGRALDAAKRVPGVVAATGYYQVSHQTQPTSEWRAAQGIELTGHDGAAMLKLVGSLQAQGLALQGLSWQLSPEVARHARADATKAALGALRERAEAAAAVLGLRFASFREVDLDPNRQGPMPLGRAMALSATPGAIAPPSAEAQDIDVDATVAAEAVLVPAQP